ncbi:MAG: DUF2169 domain-containing protein [Tabrizicola sp.]|nr:DUF2169 domain-containing protein [Tabrizicola sp.]
MGDPALSSTRYEADIAPGKPLPEVIVNGTAHAPGDAPAEAVMVGLQIAEIRKVLQVTGDRVQHLGGFSQPNAFRTMPLIWERAWGGTAANGATEARNPVGIGHDGARSADPAAQSDAANLTRPDQVLRAPGDRAEPAGFGSLGRGWQPRLGFAGTYDQAWLDTQWPLPPLNLDPRHHLCAPADQQSRAIGPGVSVTLMNMTPDGRWEFRLPRLSAPVRLLRDDRVEETEFLPDTVLIEPDLHRVTLKARMSFVTRRRAPKLREILVGHVSPVFLGARRRRKIYINPLGGDGTLADVPVWST